MRLSTDRAASCPSGGQAQGDFPSLALSPDAAQASEGAALTGNIPLYRTIKNGLYRADPRGHFLVVEDAFRWPGLRTQNHPASEARKRPGASGAAVHGSGGFMPERWAGAG
ncbi:hypothetical protein PsaNZ64_31655 [Pseudomonas syringae pv. actinidiae]|nr:hypothetical protein PsaNZ47_29845 [Pseudomonas syringae pv. actinidiae]OKS47895.1 hypothetical protein PsaNZ62_27020 [Pseudomonas syringae pv. actinidiae]OKS62158.1 hypothetical protein PsaNZ64_31655 [Pseudomonas syringae pv. actinidiae]OKS65776.1 hypothetical protein PsaNZ65_27450 [Pseudomonas syringae pv. actinidiae]